MGDEVWLEYYNSGESLMLAQKFGNKSFDVDRSPIEAEVRDRAEKHVDEVREKKGAAMTSTQSFRNLRRKSERFSGSR